MKNNSKLSEAGQQYAAAYKAHYTARDLHEALNLYKGVIAAHPNTKEAEYAKSQIQNIVNAAVPGEECLDVQMDLASALFEKVD